ncbi:MAG: twin-arginine translocase TatA/TatE family subunit, partial [Deltaproteobacteria bacterium]|nr:twin-arginine translocase TatA/TatE family subunit [Deltaproteobacteria bacterium]
MIPGGIGMPELLIILVIILIIFGAGKLPEIGKGLGRGIRNFRKATSG